MTKIIYLIYYNLIIIKYIFLKILLNYFWIMEA